MRILLTGFDPFGGEPINPALEAVKSLDGRTVAGASVSVCELPTARWRSLEVLKGAIAKLDPDIVISIGQAGGRFDITPERVAINVDDYRIKDNDGNQPVDEAIETEGPTAYWSTLPIKAMVSAMKEAGVPASVSNSAGTFVCNHVFYGLMHILAQEGNRRKGGFIHIPYLPEQAARLGGQPSMSLDCIVGGLEAALAAAVTVDEDHKKVGGTIC
ncbi:pyroglutamyl-peptidase I [Dethiosulfovibrio salsuginis]|uniref:Pyrrolidone-carboxylate peptidase n=1 Tax=Dethiosulfovibrio salsuginis TaxID=561720 RepID=A0A1X7LDX2_9BACT|nr:pyroglutamyl-peptidase I [Dethiosulfovibrio salsuginis]SMG52041.1 pyroglutamyl-peptidase [Dethiosulfovibrio salsuginis]